MKRYAMILFLAGALGVLLVVFIARERVLSERLFLIDPAGQRATGAPVIIRAGRIVQVEGENSLITLSSPERGSGEPTLYLISAGPQADIIRRDAVREGNVVVGVRETRGLSLSDIPEGSYAAVNFYPDSYTRTFSARVIVFGDFPIGPEGS